MEKNRRGNALPSRELAAQLCGERCVAPDWVRYQCRQIPCLLYLIEYVYVECIYMYI